MSVRSGTTLIELVTTLALLGLLSTACAALLRSQARLLQHTAERSALAETLRAARGIVHAELRDISVVDVRDVARDSIALRVFRGQGIVCALADSAVVLRYRGLRELDPAKDSLLIVNQEQVTSFRILTERQLCVPRAGEQLVTIELAAGLAEGSVVLAFESGSYHIADRALRYRRGIEGRQPLTDELLDDQRSSFARGTDGVDATFQGRTTGVSANTHVRFSGP